ncbi:MAG: vWA domain-containing protein [Gemmataceae bacterium]
MPVSNPTPSPGWGLAPGRAAVPVPRWARPDPRGPAGWGRLAAVTALALGLLAATAAAVWLGLWYRPPRPVALVLVGAGYETNLAVPHNVPGWRSAERLAGTRAADGWVTTGPPLRLRAGDPWDRDLDAADAPTVVVYLALRGGADEQGAYLLPDDTTGRDDPGQRLRVADVVARLGRLPAGRTKLLVLDATQGEASWPLGQLGNDFARALADLDSAIAAVPNLIVLVGSGPDQRSWASPERGESVFGRAVREVLAGDVPDLNGDGWMQLDEALAEIAGRVGAWARTNRGVSQTPVVLPAADGRQRAARVSLGRSKREPAAGPDPPAAELPADLAAVWAEASGVRAWTPGPEVYAPAEWRTYLATLLRYEELALAGDQANAGQLRGRLREFAGSLDRARALALSSGLNSLPMSAVTGPLPADGAASRAAEELWPLPPAEASARWPERFAPVAADSRAAAAFRLGVMARLFELALTATGSDLGRLTRLLRLVEDPARPRPVESHFLAILDRDAATPRPPDELVRRAISTALLAERAAVGLADPPGQYSYSERVGPFTRALLDPADAARLAAQDRLFASDAESWSAARTGLDQAAAQYAKVAATAAAARRVLAVRHRVAAELPFYSAWLAARPRPTDEAESRALDDAVTQAQAMWDEWHALGAAFTRAEGAEDPAAAVAPLAERAAALQKQLDQLATDFSDRMADLAEVDLPSVWREAEVGLGVPFLAPDVRRRLILNARRTSWKFLTESRPDAAPPTSPQKEAERSDDRARRQGRLALATLGRTWFDRPAGGQPVPGWEGYEVTAHRLTTFAADRDGWRSLLRAGTEIGRRFQQLPDDAKPAANRAALLAADELARIIPAGPAARLADNPAVRCRQFYLGELFTRLGRRAWTEHWFALEPDDEPYYLRAGRLFRADAAGAAGEKELRELLDKPGRLRIAAAPRPLGRTGAIALTSELSATITGALEPEPGAVVPPGTAVWQPTPGDGLSLVGDPGRRPAAVGGSPASLVTTVRNDLLTRAEQSPPDTPAPVPTRLAVRAWFRGQRIDQVRPVAAYPRPAVTVDEYPSPRLASVAVRARPELVRAFGTGSGGVAFVLDCSGSMGVPPGEPFTDSAKYAQATHALEQVLAVVPAGTRVSVRVFGQAVGPGRTAAAPEDTIHTVLPPTPWRPADPGQRDALMRAVRYPALDPWNESPVLRAMAAARADLADDPGFKTVVVLTDGQDNRFDKDRTLNPDKLDFPTLLAKLFRDSGIAVHVVGFRVVPAELDAVKKQFAGLGTPDLPGSFTTADHVDELFAALRRALRPELRYRVDTEDQLPVAGVGDDGLLVGGGPGSDRWVTAGLDPAGYRLKVRGWQRAEADIALAPGDRLLLKVGREAGGLRFERALLADDYPGRPGADRGGWRLTVPQVQRRGEGVQALAWLEKRFDAAETQLQMLRPRAVWFDLTTTGTPAAVTWHAVPGYAAPAWGFAAPAWPPAPARPTLRAWWNPDHEAVVAGRLDRGADFDALADLADRPLTIDGEVVAVRAAVEPHVVNLAPDRRGSRPCLVVRVAHGPDNPVRVRVRGVRFEGSSLWQYPGAGETTAVFWGGDADRAGETLQAIEIISLRAFRREADRRGFAATLDALPAPDPADERPRPPVSLP